MMDCYFSAVIFFTCGMLMRVDVVDGQDDFYFKKWPTSPPSGSLKEGQNLRLDCRVSSDDRIAISWMLDGELVLNTSRRYQDPVTGDLIIRRVDHRMDTGDFACTATNMSSGFSIASQPATLSILWIGNSTRINGQLGSSGRDLLASQGGPVFANPGDNVVLQCLADGSTELQYEWHLNGRKLAGSRTSKNNKLSLNNVGPAESGTYTCSAKNGAGSARFNTPFVLSAGSKKLVRFHKEVVTPSDSIARLPCSFEKSPVSIEWLFRGVVLGKTAKYTVEQDGQLVISKVGQNDEGWYLCRASSGEEFASRLKIAFLNDFSRNTIDPQPPHSNGHHYFAEYSSVELTCTAPDGLPQPAVWWEGPQGRILSVPTSSTESVLTLSRVLLEDAGVYTCRAENTVRKLSVPVHLVVTVPPMIQQHPLSTSVNEGEEAVMSCTFAGAPPPASTVRWMKDGQPLGDNLFAVQQGSRNATLRFVSVGKQHAGSYACHVHTIGHQPVPSYPAILQVREKLKFTLAPVGRKLELGSSSKILCRAQGTPTPVVRWAKEGLPLFSWPPHVEDVNGTLYFHGVQTGDAGYYTCIATNSQGLINTTIYVDVIVMPHFTSLPDNITFSKEGQLVELHCRAEGQPTPTIQWDKDSIMNGFFSDRFTVHPNGTLSIQNVQAEDEGHYGCTAGNAGGFKRAEFRLVVQGWDYQSEHDANESITKTIIITLGAAASYILLSVGLLIWCRMKRSQRKLRSPDGGAMMTSAEVNAQTALLTKDGPLEAGLIHPSATAAADKLHVSSSSITKGVFLGKGRFGDVLEGFVTGGLQGPADGLPAISNSTRVILRTLTTRDEEQILEFRRQVDMLHRVLHPNLVAVLAYCRDWPTMDGVHQSVLMEHSTILKSHLLVQPLSSAQIQSATIQIVRGMNALSQARFVHRDLGTRNLLVSFQHGGSKDNQINIKVGSFGLDGIPFGSDYCVYRNQTIPLRWLPGEAVLEDEYSTKSDVWMFAVTIWELHHGGQLPLASRFVSDDSLLSELIRRQQSKDRITTPPLWSPDEAAGLCKSNTLASALARCWSHDPQFRPSFDELFNIFSEHH